MRVSLFSPQVLTSSPIPSSNPGGPSTSCSLADWDGEYITRQRGRWGGGGAPPELPDLVEGAQTPSAMWGRLQFDT